MNIAEILKKCPKGTKLYSPIFGEVNLVCVNKYSITCSTDYYHDEHFQSDGKYIANYPDAECMLFPSREQRDWSKFGVTDQASDQKQKAELKPFDKVLVRDMDDEVWKGDLFSHLGDRGVFVCHFTWWKQCIPYEGNEHLLGTTIKPEE